MSPEIVRTKRQKTVKPLNLGEVKLEYCHLPAGGTVSLHDGPLKLRLDGRIKTVYAVG